MKIIGLHALTHDDKDYDLHCVICDIAITHNLIPALTPDNEEFSTENSELVINTIVIDCYISISSKTVAINQLVSRPPPPSYYA